MKHLYLALLLLGLMSPSVPLLAQAPAAVEEVTQQFLQAISARDTTTFRQLMLPEAQVMALSQQGEETHYRWRKGSDDIEMLASPGPVLLERMWEPEVRIDGPLASVWTRYDFYTDGRFSHCGTDAFHLVKTDQGWKIASIIYTIEPDAANCPESPLGPPKE